MKIKIPEAIKRLQARVDGECIAGVLDDVDDMKLGIQAMERLKRARLLGMDYPLNLLPGEDKE